MSRAQKATLPFAISSVLMFMSLFFGTKIAGIGLLLWIVVLGWTMYKTMFQYVPISKIVERNTELMSDNFKEKKYTESAMRMLVVPLSVIGIFVVFLNIFALMFLM